MSPGESSALEVVQQAYAAFGRGDLPGLLALCMDDTDWWTNGEEARLPWAGLQRGKQQVVEGYFQPMLAFCQDTKLDMQLMAEARDGATVTVLAKWDTNVLPLAASTSDHAPSPASHTPGKPVSVTYASVYTVTDGKIAKSQNFFDVTQFAVALGLLRAAAPAG